MYRLLVYHVRVYLPSTLASFDRTVEGCSGSDVVQLPARSNWHMSTSWTGTTTSITFVISEHINIRTKNSSVNTHSVTKMQTTRRSGCTDRNLHTAALRDRYDHH